MCMSNCRCKDVFSFLFATTNHPLQVHQKPLYGPPQTHSHSHWWVEVLALYFFWMYLREWGRIVFICKEYGQWGKIEYEHDLCVRWRRRQRVILFFQLSNGALKGMRWREHCLSYHCQLIAGYYQRLKPIAKEGAAKAAFNQWAYEWKMDKREEEGERER